MTAPDLVNLLGLMDGAKCSAFVRQHRWPEGVRCPGCGSSAVIRDGCDDTQPHLRRYRCKACAGASMPHRRAARGGGQLQLALTGGARHRVRRPEQQVSAYLQGFGRYGVPLGVVYGPERPEGEALPELLSASAVLGALDRAEGAAPKTLTER